MMGLPQNCNYLLEGGPLVVQVSPIVEHSRNSSVSVFYLAFFPESAFNFSELFLKAQHVCPFHDE